MSKLKARSVAPPKSEKVEIITADDPGLDKDEVYNRISYSTATARLPVKLILVFKS